MTTTATMKEAGWTLTLRRSPWSYLRNPDATSDSNEDAAGEDGIDSGAVGGDNVEDGDDDPAAPDGGDEDPDDDPELAVAADPPPPEPHYEKQIYRWTLLKVYSQHFSRGPCR
jgi:hypothetical protein